MHKYIPNTYIHTYIQTRTCTQTYTHAYTNAHPYIHAHIHTCILLYAWCIFVCAYIHLHFLQNVWEHDLAESPLSKNRIGRPRARALASWFLWVQTHSNDLCLHFLSISDMPVCVNVNFRMWIVPCLAVVYEESMTVLCLRIFLFSTFLFSHCLSFSLTCVLSHIHRGIPDRHSHGCINSTSSRSRNVKNCNI